MAKRRLNTLNEDSSEKQFLDSYDDRPEHRTVTSRARTRSEMSDQVQAFLSQGGQINEIERHVMADPPRKPISKYGSKAL